MYSSDHLVFCERLSEFPKQFTSKNVTNYYLMNVITQFNRTTLRILSTKKWLSLEKYYGTEDIPFAREELKSITPFTHDFQNSRHVQEGACVRHPASHLDWPRG
ncbi:hypothetical protein U27_03438 [Candidatus Vecturithrix granuli]|uniref:Uncharacterized protein n=1 Tax=Vecturithrix granuli TaxID=1499967 RepID=A0A081BVX1_VECG1|nr:hypothetical protein U27_03438 [Candidatus Vecturithrix granuli]